MRKSEREKVKISDILLKEVKAKPEKQANIKAEKQDKAAIEKKKKVEKKAKDDVGQLPNRSSGEEIVLKRIEKDESEVAKEKMIVGKKKINVSGGSEGVEEKRTEDKKDNRVDKSVVVEGKLAEEKHNSNVDDLEVTHEKTIKVEDTTVLREAEFNLEIKVQDDAKTIVPELDKFDKKMKEVFKNKNTEKIDSKKEIIKLENVELRYEDDDLVVENVDFSIKMGEFVFIVGPSGSGKSSIMKMLYREKIPTRGHIYVNEVDIHEIKNSQVPFMRREIGVVFQNYQLLPNKNVFENVAFALEATKYPKEKIEGRVVEVLSIVGLEDKLSNFPRQLSGGEQQRVSIARAIINEPKIVIADEPTGNLDPENTEIIMKILNYINDSGVTIMMATHDMEIIKNYPNRTLVVNGKTIKESD